ncbi:MAG: nicotinate-nucleotide adenylyltransferase [Gammaproteobacteria bacterium]|nr:nicotinate-nucleotide adenylyltransferase [Gammaproteobacteria bacterium]
MAKPVGILGGTFDPVHHGHLRLALELIQLLDLAEIRLIPLHTPAHRNMPVASPEQRLAMLQLGIDNETGLLIDDREIIRQGISYSIDTLTTLRDELDSRPLCLIMGMDAFQKLNDWREWTLLLDYAHIIIVNRPANETHIEQQEIAQLYSAHCSEDPYILQRSPAGSIVNINIPMLDISATRIRQLISTNQTIHYLLPDSVISYIQKQNLYCN